MVRVLITGGAGYLGSTLTQHLLDNFYKVDVLDNLIHGGNQLIPFFNHKNFNFIKGDIRDKDLELVDFPVIEHVHNFSWYIGNYPTLERDKIDNLIRLLNEVK